MSVQLKVLKPCVVSDATNWRRPKLIELAIGTHTLERRISPFAKGGLTNLWLVLAERGTRVVGLCEGDWQKRVRAGIVKMDEVPALSA